LFKRPKRYLLHFRTENLRSLYYSWKRRGGIEVVVLTSQVMASLEERRIPVNALSAGRRRKSTCKGKAKLPPGRPKGMKVAMYPTSRYIMPNRKQALSKRLHSLKYSIQQGTQNGGKR